MVRNYLWGFAGSAAILSLYFAILILSNSLNHAMEELKVIGGWIALLVLGFGIQSGLFAFIRGMIKKRAGAKATASMAAAGGVSTTAMVACCMHHVTDILPILGASAAAIFFVQYQTPLLAIGVSSNLIGINLMLRIIQKNGLYRPDRGILRHIVRYDMDKVMVLNVLAGISLFIVIFLGTLKKL